MHCGMKASGTKCSVKVGQDFSYLLLLLLKDISAMNKCPRSPAQSSCLFSITSWHLCELERSHLKKENEHKRPHALPFISFYSVENGLSHAGFHWLFPKIVLWLWEYKRKKIDTQASRFVNMLLLVLSVRMWFRRKLTLIIFTLMAMSFHSVPFKGGICHFWHFSPNLPWLIDWLCGYLSK